MGLIACKIKLLMFNALTYFIPYTHTHKHYRKVQESFYYQFIQEQQQIRKRI